MKKHPLLAFIVLVTAAAPGWGQKVETQAPGHTAITRVETALNHLTVIELAEPVVSVAAGSGAFKVEWRENRVFVEPSEPDVSTNLFIWTNSGRFNYELEPAGEVSRMDFAIDEPPIPHSALRTPTPKIEPPSRGAVDDSALLGGRPVRISAYKAGRGCAQLLIKDLFQQNNQLFIRFVVENSTGHAFKTGTPQVFLLELPRGPKDLVEQHNSQLTDSEARKIESARQIPLEVVHEDSRSAWVLPGAETVGIVEIRIPAPQPGPTILRVVVPAEGQGRTSATLVM